MPLCGSRVGKEINILMIQTLVYAHQADPWVQVEERLHFLLEMNQIASEAGGRINPREPRKQNKSASSSSSAETFIAKWGERDREKKRRSCSLAARSAGSSVFTLECQQVKVGDNTVWCCQTEFLPPNFTSSSSPRPLSRLQSPPSPPSLLYLSLLTLIHCSRALQFKALRNTPSTLKKNCNPNFFLQTPPPPSAE